MSCAELRRAALSGDGVPSLEHARDCADCASARASVLELSALATALDPPDPSAERMANLRAKLVMSAAPRTHRLPRAWMASAAIVVTLAAAAMAVVSLRVPTPHGTIDPGQGARFVHPAVRAGEPEIVRVFDGTVSVDVSPLEAGERFLVMTEDAEIEVRGTRFDVVVVEEKLERVWVREGRVEVRALGALPVILRTGDAWNRPSAHFEPPAAVTPPPEPAPLPSPASVAPKPRRPSAPRAVIDVAPHERAFRDAWAAFARGDMGKAAELFAQAEAAVPGEPLAEDACYGHAVSLERGGRRREAITEMKRFLHEYPRAVRGDEVAVSLGLLLLEAGDVEAARALFERGASSDSAEIRQSALRGLESSKR